MRYKEIKYDLFNVDDSYVLGHCISKDCAMGAGIAKEFRKRYPDMPGVVKRTNPQIGDAIIYNGEEWPIFNLVTKENYWNKPTYQTLTNCILEMKNKMIATGYKKLAIPMIGAGLDKLNWGKNRENIKKIFEDTDIDIVVCKLK